MDADFGESCNKYNIQNGQRQSSSDGGKQRRTMVKKDFCLAQVFGVFLFALGLVAGVLIGIYVYHGNVGEAKQSTQVFGMFLFAFGLVAGVLMWICVYHGNVLREAGQSTKVTPAGQGGATPGTTARVTSAQSPPVTTTPTTDAGQPGPDCDTCKRRDPREEWDGEDPQIFAPLCRGEIMEVQNFLSQNGYVTRRTQNEALSLNMNYATAMALSPPNKAAVMAYKSGKGPYPGRYALVNMVRGSRPSPDYMEYKVGPLFSSSPITAQQLYSDGELHFNSRPYDYVETAVYNEIVKADFKTLEPLTMESFDGAVMSKQNYDFALFYFTGPPGSEAAKRETRLIATLNPLAPNGYDFLELDFLPLSATIHCPGNNVSTWYVYDYYYLNQGPYSTAQELLDAYTSGAIRKFSLPTGYRAGVLGRHLPDRDVGAPYRRHASMPPPRTYEPEGPRYTLKGHNVDYMGWNFDVSSGQFRGPGLFAVTFKGQSIAYEVSLNEIAVVYGSGGSAQTNTIYTDSSYGIGEYYGVVPSVDCPEHTGLLDTSHWDVYIGEPVVHKSICVYEADGENALWRHKGYAFEGGLRNNYLVVRASATIDNYDYIVEWHFYLDGKIYTIVSASGYIQGSFWDHDNPFMGSDKSRDSFGFKVQENTHGSMHDHMFGFKVDLDILGTENTMEVVHLKAGDVLTALRSQGVTVDKVPPYFLNNNTRYVEYEYVENEASFRINLDEPKFWVVVNQEEQNRWGVKRGYQIKPLSTSAQTLTDAHHVMPALSFTKYHCSVTKRKEDEQYLSSTSDVNRLDTPIGYLEKHLDGEFINQTDIVNWVTVGFLHLPTSEDVPMTNRVESGFMLKPFNFFDRTEVFDMPGYLDTREGSRSERPPSYTPCLEKPVDDTCEFC